MCMHALCVHVCTCPCALECICVGAYRGQKKGIRPSGAGVIGGCALPNLSAGNQTPILCKSRSFS